MCMCSVGLEVNFSPFNFFYVKKMNGVSWCNCRMEKDTNFNYTLVRTTKLTCVSILRHH